MEYNKITIVDENDVLVGYESYDIAMEKHLTRRTCCIYIADEEGNHLLQKRSIHISKPGKLDKAVGGHVDEGETYKQAAVRELKEEIGLVDLELTEIVTSFRTSEFFQAVYKATVPRTTIINFDPQEIESMLWMSTSEIDAHVQAAPGDFTPSFVEIWERLRDKIIA